MIESNNPSFFTSNEGNDGGKTSEDLVSMSLPESKGDHIVAEQAATESEIKPDLYSREGIEKYLKQSTDANDFDKRYDAVSEAHGGNLPDYWFTLMNGGGDSAAGSGMGVLGYLYQKGVLKRQ